MGDSFGEAQTGASMLMLCLASVGGAEIAKCESYGTGQNSS